MKEGHVSVAFYGAFFPGSGPQSSEKAFQGIMPSLQGQATKLLCREERTGKLRFFLCVSITFHKALGDVCLIELTTDTMSGERSFGFLSGTFGSFVVLMFSFHTLI